MLYPSYFEVVLFYLIEKKPLLIGNGVLLADLYARISQRVFNRGVLVRIIDNVEGRYVNLDLNNNCGNTHSNTKVRMDNIYVNV